MNKRLNLFILAGLIIALILNSLFVFSAENNLKLKKVVKVKTINIIKICLKKFFILIARFFDFRIFQHGFGYA